jgi:phosphoglycerol transferase MdoB-like AlkP superfamily enzyme
MQLSFKQYYWRWLKNLFILALITLALLSIARIGFSFAFGEWAELKTYSKDFKRSLLLGIRFDLIPIAYINLVPFLLLNLFYLVPGKAVIKIVRSSAISFLFFGYSFLLWVYICDFAFFSYFQEHLNILFFGFIEDDTVALLTSIWKNYNLPVWLVLIFIFHFIILKSVRVCFSTFDFDLNHKKRDWRVLVAFVFGLLALGFAGRGNFSRLPLSLEDAHISSSDFINKVSLNGVLTFNRAIKIRKTFGASQANFLKKYGFENWEQAFNIHFGKSPVSSDLTTNLMAKTSDSPKLRKELPHVVLVVMESFGSYWNPHHQKTFNILGSLEEHFKKGILFKNFLPAENGTIGSIVSVATSQVIRPGARFLSESDYMKTSLSISGQLPYKKAGYDTHFVYGGKLGWRDLGKYLTIQKYDSLWGADEIKESMPELNNIGEEDLGNEWGIYDEYLYTFIEEQLRTASRPQFFLVLTTSNHPPFEYPSSYQELPLIMDNTFLDRLTVDEDLARKRFLGLQYGNQKMGEFLSRIKSTALTDNVVVALTGDHSYWITKGVGLDEEFKRYAVPFFITVPDRLKPKTYDPENFGSHEDIFPTLYNLTLPNQDYLKLGDDLINEEGIAQNSSGLIASKKGAYHHGQYWRWQNLSSQILAPSVEDQELKLIRQKGEALIGLTDIYLKEEKSHKPTDVKNGQQ